MTFTELQIEVSDYVGYGRTLANLSTEALSRVESCVKSGYIRFLRPTIKEHLGYRWNFLSPQVNLSLLQDTETYALSLEYGAIVGNIFFDDAGYAPIACDVGEGNISINRATNSTGTPRMAAVKMVKTVAEDTSWTITKELIVFPIPDQDYDVHFNVYLYTEKLIDQTTTVFGSEYYGETIRQACLASAELEINDEIGIHSKTFDAMLLASIEQDLQETPTQWGNAGDRRYYSQADVSPMLPSDYARCVNGVGYDSITISGIEM